MLSATRRAPDDFGLGSVQMESIGTHPRRHVVDRRRHLKLKLCSICRVTAAILLRIVTCQHTNVDADCTSQQAAISPLYITRTASVLGPILVALHTEHLWVVILICNSG